MYRDSGMGAEEFGPPIPTTTQAVTQGMTDMSKDIRKSTGFPIEYIIGAGVLIGYMIYTQYGE